jgi:short-subunit dehydrogenase
MDSKTVVITGASSGIGAVLATQLAGQGHRVALGARRAAELAQVAGPLGPAAVAVPMDATSRSGNERLRDRAIEAFGQVDVWVCNAGRGITRPVLDLTDEDVDEILAVNLKSVLYGMQAIVPHFKARSAGHFITVSSFLGRVPIVGFRSIYSAAKAAANSLTANLRMDLAASHPGIHVSLVIPGMVATEFGRKAIGGVPAVRPPARTVPAPQSPDEVAAVIAGVIETRAAEVYTNPAQAQTVARYYQDVAAFERGQPGAAPRG